MKQLFLFLFVSSLLFTTFAAVHPSFADDHSGSFFGKWFSDDDDDHWKERKPASGKNYLAKKKHKHLIPVTDPLYLEECGSCHFAYQPELLPKKSWIQIFANLEEHFGEDASIEKEEQLKLEAYIFTHSAETSNSKKAKKLFRSLRGKAPLRITEIPYFVHEHDEISPRRIQQENIKSIANCDKCHSTADRGIYSERYIKIPRP